MPLPRRGAGVNGIAVLGFTLISLHSLLGQDIGPISRPGEPLTVWVVATADASCGAAITPEFVRQDVESQLRTAGVRISRVHKAALTAIAECTTVATRRRVANLSVRQCLELSQSVSLPSKAGGSMLATTWSSCGTYDCKGGKCAEQIHAGLKELVDSFLADFWMANLVSQTASPHPQPSASGLMPSLALDAPHLSPGSVIYCLYIMACALVLLRWEYRRRLN